MLWRIFTFMKIFWFLSLFFLSQICSGQCDSSRYQSSIYNVTLSENVEYGQAPQWSFPYFDEVLLMDIYEPEMDELELRPCIIWAHPGGFLLGDKQADDMVALCDSMARTGYVSASIAYRKGFNPLDATSSERAVYRGTQDGRAAYRFLVENHELYGIDTTKMFFGGSSAGALITHHLAFVSEDERPESSFAQDLAPDLGCIDCTGNDFDHEVAPLGIIGLWGAIGDTAWVNEPVNTLMVHGTGDLVVPYNVGPPFELFTLPDVYGSLPISEKMTELELPFTLESVVGEGHEPHGTNNGYWNDEPNDYWPVMYELITDFCFELIRPEPPVISGVTSICEGDLGFFSVAINENQHVCWTAENALLTEISANSVNLEPLDDSPILLTAQIYNEVNAASEVTVLEISTVPNPEVAWDINLDGNLLEFSALTLMNTAWILNGETVSMENTGTVTLKTAGDYEVLLEVENEFGCITTYTEQFVLVVDGILEVKSDRTKLIWNGEFNTIESSYDFDLSIYNASGKLMREHTAVKRKELHLTPGVYLLAISGNGWVEKKKLLVL